MKPYGRKRLTETDERLTDARDQLEEESIMWYGLPGFLRTVRQYFSSVYRGPDDQLRSPGA